MEKNALRDVYFAGGCFWGVEEYFSRIPGVVETSVGYANGMTDSPSYEQVCTGRTGHAETVHVRYDPGQVSLETLADQFFKIIDPTSRNRQGNDIGPQYRTGMYYVDEADRPVLARIMEREQEKYSRPLAVELGPLQNYAPAEGYHQAYLKKNPGGYCHISFDGLKELPPAGKAGQEAVGSLDPARYHRETDEALKRRLSPLAFDVVRHAGTERAFSGEFWDNKTPGLYVDAATGEPLFSSKDKFDSGTGWPSFTRPIAPQVVTEHEDASHGMRRTEVKSRVGDSHLGHVFPDGPRDRGGQRYCINSAAMRFVPYEKMDEEGYGDLKDKVK